jgi:hypothetical protein
MLSAVLFVYLFINSCFYHDVQYLPCYFCSFDMPLYEHLGTVLYTGPALRFLTLLHLRSQGKVPNCLKHRILYKINLGIIHQYS